MKKFSKYLALSAMCLTISLTGCTEDEELTTSSAGIPLDKTAQPNPVLTGESTLSIPNMSAPIIEEGTDGKVLRFSLTGIKTYDNDWLRLYGTSDKEQNIWIEIDGKPRGFTVVNGDEVGSSRATSSTKAMADVVFLVDNSGSMGEEADAVAREILEWAETLSQTMDVQFGCVGYGENDNGYYTSIDGALDIADVTLLQEFMQRSYGIYRTRGFYGPEANRLQTASETGNYYNGGRYNECGALALHFADDNFSFREGSNRIYVNLTDEPNQPGKYEEWSVESINPESEFYNWNTAKGTIHTVFSENPERYSFSSLTAEQPWLMSEYTGGSVIYAPSSFEGVTLGSLDVTGAILNSYIIRFNVTDDLMEGVHTIKITILSKDGTYQGEKVFNDVSFISDMR